MGVAVFNTIKTDYNTGKDVSLRQALELQPRYAGMSSPTDRNCQCQEATEVLWMW